VIGLLALGAWLLRDRGSLAALRVPRTERRDVFRLSLGSMIGWHLGLIYGVMLLNSGRAAIIGYTMPVWALVASVMFYGERFSWRGVAGVALALAATGLLALAELDAFLAAPLGLAVMLAGAISWGVGTAMTRNTPLSIDSEALTFWTLAIAMLVFVAGAVLFEQAAWRLPDLPEALAMLYGGVVTFAFCYVGWFRVARKLPPVASSLSIMLVPVVGLASGSLMLGEVITGFDLVALCLIIAAMAAVLWPGLRPRRPPPC
jgi:drug/metabolite transporter (DMT)-like permease